MVSVIFVRKSIHFSTNIFVSIIFNHSIAELFISYESVMDTLEASLLALLFQLVGDVVFFVSRNLSSRTNRSWIPWKYFFLHFFLS